MPLEAVEARRLYRQVADQLLRPTAASTPWQLASDGARSCRTVEGVAADSARSADCFGSRGPGSDSGPAPGIRQRTGSARAAFAAAQIDVELPRARGSKAPSPSRPHGGRRLKTSRASSHASLEAMANVQHPGEASMTPRVSCRGSRLSRQRRAGPRGRRVVRPAALSPDRGSRALFRIPAILEMPWPSTGDPRCHCRT